jgi:hypothetical protein
MKLHLAQLDRRIIYFSVLLALLAPLLLKTVVKPARMVSAEKLYEVIENLKVGPSDIALVAIDFGPNSKAENEPQAEEVIEHLMRRRIPFAMYSQYMLAQTFLDSIPDKVAKRLMRENPGQRWQYGKDWVNLGLKLSGSIMIKGIAGAEDLVAYLNKDAQGNSLADLPAFKGVRTLENIKLFAQFTSLTGTFESYIQFLKSEKFRPIFVHGCTSITIPKAYIYLDSKQIVGLLEGVAGAAWYSELLNRQYPGRGKDDALAINTGLGVAQLVVVFLVLLGNVAAVVSARRRT